VQVGQKLNLTTGHVFRENVVPLLPDSLKMCNKFCINTTTVWPLLSASRLACVYVSRTCNVNYNIGKANLYFG
jgi:hypothetical protein